MIDACCLASQLSDMLLELRAFTCKACTCYIKIEAVESADKVRLMLTGRAWVNGDVVYDVPPPADGEDEVLSLVFLSVQQQSQAEQRIEEAAALSPKVLRDLLHGLNPFSNPGRPSSTGWSILGGPYGELQSAMSPELQAPCNGNRVHGFSAQRTCPANVPDASCG